MSDTFQFLNKDKENSSNDDAAQTFLDEKLSKNKYTQSQQETLDQNGGPSVAGGGDGNNKSLSTLYKEKFGTDPIQDLQVGGDTNAANAVYANIKSLKDDDFWKGQNLSNLMGKAGHEETSGVIIGTHLNDGGLRVNASIENGINFDDINSQLTEKGWGDDYKQNSIIQLGSSMLEAGGKDSIEHSPEIKQAKERVRAYENDILSGKTSEDIYGKDSNSDYEFDAAKGAAGIGTPLNGDSGQQAAKASASFLDNKKSEVKRKYQFQPQS